ncbi:MAG TPA: FHA domain-containing protein [Pirellulales bacterium]|nr:FHA domain-containing protein [Pirellulales bacterium]
MEAKLVVIGGKANKTEVQLKLPTVIGRGRDADLTVAHPTVSRHHCVLFEQDGALFVRDNGSLNGTLIDGNKVQEAQLKPGETLTVGPLTFRADYQLADKLPSMPHSPTTDHLAETSGPALPSSGAAPDETIQFDAAANESPAESPADSAPSFGFLGAAPAVEAQAESPPDESPPNESLPDESLPDESLPDESPPDESPPDESPPDESLVDESPPAESSLDLRPPANMDDEDVIDFLDDKPDLPPTAAVAPADGTRNLEPVAASDPAEFTLAPAKKKPADIDEEVFSLLGGNDEKPSAKHVEGVPEIKIEDDGKPGKAAAKPAAGDDELNDFFQSLGVK